MSSGTSATAVDALTPEDASRARWAQAGVVAVFFVHGLLFASWTAHIPSIKAHLRLDDATLGLALLGTPLGSVTAIALAAYLVPRTGSRLVVQVSLVAYCLSGPFVGLTGSVAGLFVALFAWGTFQGFLDISMNTQAIAVEGRRRRPLMNGFHAYWSFGAFAGAGLGTLGVTVGLSLSRQLLVLGLPVMIAAGWLTLRMLQDSVTAPDGDDPAPKTRRISGAMLLLGAIAFASMLAEGAAADWSSVYIRESLGGGTAAGGLGYVGFALGMVLVRLLGDRLLARHAAQRLLPALTAGTTIGFAVALLVGAVPLALAGFFLLGFGLGAVVPAAFSAAGRLPGIHPGVGVAGVSGLGWAGFVCGPPIIGQLAGLTSLPVALGLVPVLTAFIAVASARVVALRMPG